MKFIEVLWESTRYLFLPVFGVIGLIYLMCYLTGTPIAYDEGACHCDETDTGRGSFEVEESTLPNMVYNADGTPCLSLCEAAETAQDENNENARIEAALTEQGYFNESVPLDAILQDYLHTACEESSVDYALALAVIEQETGFRNVIGDDGASVGYMQVQERWNGDRMERLGVTDLSDPISNFRVGCDCLSEYISKYGLPAALTAYNSGKPGDSTYSREVMERYARWAEVLA